MTLQLIISEVELGYHTFRWTNLPRLTMVRLHLPFCNIQLNFSIWTIGMCWGGGGINILDEIWGGGTFKLLSLKYEKKMAAKARLQPYWQWVVSYPCLYNTIQYNAVQCNAIQYNTIQHHITPQHNTTQYNMYKL